MQAILEMNRHNLYFPVNSKDKTAAAKYMDNEAANNPSGFKPLIKRHAPKLTEKITVHRLSIKPICLYH